jgi:hypothetical protein
MKKRIVLCLSAVVLLISLGCVKKEHAGKKAGAVEPGSCDYWKFKLSKGDQVKHSIFYLGELRCSGSLGALAAGFKAGNHPVWIVRAVGAMGKNAKTAAFMLNAIDHPEAGSTALDFAVKWRIAGLKPKLISAVRKAKDERVRLKALKKLVELTHSGAKQTKAGAKASTKIGPIRDMDTVRILSWVTGTTPHKKQLGTVVFAIRMLAKVDWANMDDTTVNEVSSHLVVANFHVGRLTATVSRAANVVYRAMGPRAAASVVKALKGTNPVVLKHAKKEGQPPWLYTTGGDLPLFVWHSGNTAAVPDVVRAMGLSTKTPPGANAYLRKLTKLYGFRRTITWKSTISYLLKSIANTASALRNPASVAIAQAQITPERPRVVTQHAAQLLAHMGTKEATSALWAAFRRYDTELAGLVERGGKQSTVREKKLIRFKAGLAEPLLTSLSAGRSASFVAEVLSSPHEAVRTRVNKTVAMGYMQTVSQCGAKASCYMGLLAQSKSSGSIDLRSLSKQRKLHTFRLKRAHRLAKQRLDNYYVTAIRTTCLNKAGKGCVRGIGALCKKKAAAGCPKKELGAARPACLAKKTADCKAKETRGCHAKVSSKDPKLNKCVSKGERTWTAHAEKGCTGGVDNSCRLQFKRNCRRWVRYRCRRARRSKAVYQACRKRAMAQSDYCKETPKGTKRWKQCTASAIKSCVRGKRSLRRAVWKLQSEVKILKSKLRSVASQTMKLDPKDPKAAGKIRSLRKQHKTLGAQKKKAVAELATLNAEVTRIQDELTTTHKQALLSIGVKVSAAEKAMQSLPVYVDAKSSTKAVELIVRRLMDVIRVRGDLFNRLGADAVLAFEQLATPQNVKGMWPHLKRLQRTASRLKNGAHLVAAIDRLERQRAKK